MSEGEEAVRLMPAAPYARGLSNRWTLLLVLTAMFALFGCHDTSQLEVCAEIDCGAGECVWAEGTGQFCRCPAGYHDEGPHCVADGPDGDLDADADHDTGDADEDAELDADEDLDADQETSPPATLEDAFDLGRGQSPIDMGFGDDRVVVAFMPDQYWTELPEGERDIIQFRLVSFASGAPAMIASAEFDVSGSAGTLTRVGRLVGASGCGSATASPWAITVIGLDGGGSRWLSVSSDGSDQISVDDIGPTLLAGTGAISENARVVDSGTGCYAVWEIPTASGAQLMVRHADGPDGDGSEPVIALEETSAGPWVFEALNEDGGSPVVPIAALVPTGGVVVAAPARRRADGAAIVVAERIDAAGELLWGLDEPGVGVTLFDSATLVAAPPILAIDRPEPNSMAVLGLGVWLMVPAMTGATSTSDRCVYWTSATLDRGRPYEPIEVVPCALTTRRVQVALISGVPTPTVASTYWEWSGALTPPFAGHLFLPDNLGAGEIELSPAYFPMIAPGRGGAVANWVTGSLSEGADLHVLTIDEALVSHGGWPADGFLLSSVASGASIGPDPSLTPLPRMLADGSVLQVWGQLGLADGSRSVALRRVLPPH
jgi:hypothetical protein